MNDDRRSAFKPAEDETDALVHEKDQSWYWEALERKLKANEFRYRSEYGNPIIGRSGLEEIYKKASNDNWKAAINPKFEQLQAMRILNSAFLPYEQHKKKMQEDKTDSISKETKVKATPSKSPRTSRATSVPPKKKQITTTASTTTKSTKSTQPSSTQQPAKVWIKPKAKDASETSAKKVQRLQQNNNLDKELKLAQQPKKTDNNIRKVINGGRASPPILQSGLVRTTQIKSPEELAGIKSPPPANFFDNLDNNPIKWNSTNPSLNSNANYNLMNEFNPTSMRGNNIDLLS